MKRIIRVVLILILLAAAGFAVAVIVQKNKDKNNKATEQVPVVIQDPVASQPSQNAATPAPLPAPDAPTPTPTAPVPAAEVVPTPAPATNTPSPVVPAPKPTPSGTITFKSATGLRVTMPAPWHPQEEVRNGTTYTVFYNENNEVVASVESYTNTGNTLELIEQQLKTSPSISSVKKITVATSPALQYETPQGAMIVFIRNNTTYYISGSLAKDYSKISF